METGKSSIRVTERNLEKCLGKEKYSYQMINETRRDRIYRGIAWTSFGGDTLQTEVNIMPGEGEILLTGQLGDVMKESARTGIDYIRSVGEKYKIPEDFFKKHDIHIHIPEGAVPKDGSVCRYHNGDGYDFRNHKYEGQSGYGDDREKLRCGEECFQSED